MGISTRISKHNNYVVTKYWYRSAKSSRSHRSHRSYRSLRSHRSSRSSSALSSNIRRSSLPWHNYNRMIRVYCVLVLLLELRNSNVIMSVARATAATTETPTKPVLFNMIYGQRTKISELFTNNHKLSQSDTIATATTTVPDDNDHFIHNYDHLHTNYKNIDNYSSDLDHERSSIINSHHHLLTAADVNKIKQIVMQGLKLKTIPNILKVNISHEEYREKYNIYLERIRKQEIHENMEHNRNVDPLIIDFSKQLFSFSNISYSNNFYNHRRKRSVNNNDLVYIRFQLSLDDLPTDVEESTLRLLIKSHRDSSDYVPSTTFQSNINLKIYQLIEPYGRVLLDTQTVYVGDGHPTSNWIEFDVGKAIDNWMNGDSNLGFEIFCDGCAAQGMHIVHDVSFYQDLPEFSPVLNVIGKIIHREKRSRQHRHFLPNSKRKPRKTDCHKENQKCCRHTMDVVFKEIKGFEFIIQPKNFDAGYCRGKCPPRYNPAHHHAVLQSLIWKQDRNKAPRPCCAPSKLVELEVLHVDESDSSKLKVSTWSDMRVLECACS